MTPGVHFEPVGDLVLRREHRPVLGEREVRQVVVPHRVVQAQRLVAPAPRVAGAFVAAVVQRGRFGDVLAGIRTEWTYRSSRPPVSGTAAIWSPATVRSPSSSTRSETSTASSPWPAERGVRITHVVETHIHNDYVTGGLELSRTAGAEYVVPAGDDVGVRAARGPRRRCASTPARCGCGSCTPRDTPPPRQLRPRRRRGARCGCVHRRVDAHGATGRTDLVGAGAHRRADPRPVPLGAPAGRRTARRTPRCYPTHGFGSFCSATPTSGDASTVGEQRGSTRR